MKKLSIICLLLSICFLNNCFVNKEVNNSSVVNNQGVVDQNIIKLLDLTGIAHDGTLGDIVKQTQEYWLRKPNQERWHIEPYVTQHEQEIRAIFDALHMCEVVKPEQKEYDYAVVLGALFERLALRVEYVMDLWKQGIRFKKLVFLGGARPLVPEQGENEESYKKWLGVEFLDTKNLKTETDLMKFIYHHTDMPKEMKALPVEFIDAPLIQSVDGLLKRPTTESTVYEWLATDPEPGSCLCISNQPYVGFQNAVIKTYMSQEFPIDTVGPACTAHLNIGIMLDSFARFLYQEHKRLQKN